jgi:gas vesicle structural protein
MSDTPVTQASIAGLLGSPNESLVDLVDSLLDKGVVLDGELVLGLADVDLVYVRLGVLLAAADRVFTPRP